jgi:O-antigen/teichoic acid export membrane protein
MATSTTEAGTAQPPRHAAPARGLAARPETDSFSAASDAAVLTSATYVAQIMSFLAGLIQKGLLGPLGAGYWALMQSFWTYMSTATLGASAGTGRQIPMRRGREDYAGAASASDSGSSFSVLATAVLGVLMVIVALIFGGSWPAQTRWGLVLLGLTGPIRQFADNHKMIIQATKRFRASSVTAVVEAAIMLTVQSVCVVAFGFYGMFVGILFSILGLYALWVRQGLVTWTRPAYARRYDRAEIRELIKFGAPLMVQGQIWLLFMSVDNLIVAGYLSVADLGYYALGVSVTGYLLNLPRSVGSALFPRMAEEFVRTGDIRSIRHYATETQRLLAYLLVPVFLGASFFGLPVLIRHGLPSFDAAIPLIRIMVAASFMIALVNMPTKVLTTAGYRWGITALSLFCLVANGAFNYLAVATFGWGLEGAAGATVLGYVVAFLLMTGYALSRAFTPREVALHIGELLLVFVYTIGACWGIEALLGNGGGGLVPDTALAVAKLAIFLVVMLPWFVLSERRYRGPSRLAELATAGLRKVRRGRGA